VLARQYAGVDSDRLQARLPLEASGIAAGVVAGLAPATDHPGYWPKLKKATIQSGSGFIEGNPTEAANKGRN